jgi:hypothetical protein
VVPAKDPPKVEKTETKAFHSKWQICGKTMNSEFVPRKKKSNTRAFFLSFFFLFAQIQWGGLRGSRIKEVTGFAPLDGVLRQVH